MTCRRCRSSRRSTRATSAPSMKGSRRVHGAGLSERDFHGCCEAGELAVEDHGKRRELHRRGERRQCERQAAAGHDGDDRFPDRFRARTLLVPNAALRFRPTEAMREQLRKRSQASTATAPWMRNEGARRTGARMPRAERASAVRCGAASRPRNVAMLWYLDDRGELCGRACPHRSHRRTAHRSEERQNSRKACRSSSA